MADGPEGGLGGEGAHDGEAEGIAGNDGQDSNAGLGNGFGGIGLSEAEAAVREGLANSELGMSSLGELEGLLGKEAVSSARRGIDGMVGRMANRFGREQSQKGLLGKALSLDPTSALLGLRAQAHMADMHEAITGKSPSIADRAETVAMNMAANTIGNAVESIGLGLLGRATSPAVASVVGNVANIGQNISDGLFGDMNSSPTSSPAASPSSNSSSTSSNNSVASNSTPGTVGTSPVGDNSNQSNNSAPADIAGIDGSFPRAQTNNQVTLATGGAPLLAAQPDTRLDNFYGFREAETALRTV